MDSKRRQGRLRGKFVGKTSYQRERLMRSRSLVCSSLDVIDD